MSTTTAPATTELKWQSLMMQFGKKTNLNPSSALDMAAMSGISEQ
jgi:hypothetical protein